MVCQRKVQLNQMIRLESNTTVLWKGLYYGFLRAYTYDKVSFSVVSHEPPTCANEINDDDKILVLRSRQRNINDTN